MALVRFFNSDAAIEAGHDRKEVEVTVERGVQLTYGDLRELETGEPVASLIPGEQMWLKAGSYFSDVVIEP